MQQSYWHLTGNLWALSLSTAIALFLPEFGPKDIMSGGIGVVIRTTMVAPIVFSLMYWTGRLIIYLIDKLRNLIDRLRNWWLMSILMAGIEEGIRNAAERRAKEIAKRIVEEAVQQAVQTAVQTAVEGAAQVATQAATQAATRATQSADEKAAKARELDREAFMEFMRNKGVSDAEIDAFIRRLSQQG